MNAVSRCFYLFIYLFICFYPSTDCKILIGSMCIYNLMSMILILMIANEWAYMLYRMQKGLQLPTGVDG